jgi:PelA/Pel-15E family pectate lyase
MMIGRSALMLALALACHPDVAAQPATAEVEVIPLDDFSDGIKHWQSTRGKDYPRHAPSDFIQIADNLLRYQRKDGGWKENQDPLRIVDATEKVRLATESGTTGGSFDNRNIYTQVEYLAAAYARTGDTRYRDASVRGLEFILAHQDPRCGGWPHTVPGTERYHPYITLADEVTPGVLATLRLAQDPRSVFAFLDDATRTRVSQAVARGDACLLQLQVRQGNALTGWAGQYDNLTLQPAQGRKFELPAIVVQETVTALRYLMRIPQPSPEVVAAIEGGVSWLRQVQLQGLRLETFDAPAEKFAHHSSTTDRRLVEDLQAPPLWARFYDLKDNSVVLATREGVRVAKYSDIPRERRTGYEWYGTWPQKFLDKDYPKWRKRMAAGSNATP